MYKNIVVLTGAGISAESGLAIFRGQGGLWEGHRVEEVATPEAFLRSPELVQRFYNFRRKQLLEEATPNAAHHFLSKFEQEYTKQGGTFLLVTQNVDDLHERAGSANLLHMHGELLKARSTATGEVRQCREDLEGTGWRPHIVWFGEMPFEMERIEVALHQCDLFISIGTSGAVYPAAGFVSVANSVGADTVILNLDESNNGMAFQHGEYGPATEIVPKFVEELLST